MRLPSLCPGGTAQCCQCTRVPTLLSVELTGLLALHQHSDTKSQSIMNGLNLLGLGTNAPVDLSDLFMGIQCSPIGGILGGTSACNSRPVCCSGNHL